jgi:hypothetical protein
MWQKSLCKPWSRWPGSSTSTGLPTDRQRARAVKRPVERLRLGAYPQVNVRRCEKGQFCTACASQYPRPSLPGPSTCSNCFSRPTYAQCSTFQAIGPARPQRGPAIAQSRSASPPSARPSAAPQYASHGGRYWEPRGPHHPPRQAAVRAPLPPRPSARPARSPSPIGVASDPGAPSTGPPAPRAPRMH